MKDISSETESLQPETRNPHPETLIEHRASQVVLEAPGVLFFATSDKKGALIFFLMGVLCFYASITLMVWRLTQGVLHPPSLISGMIVFMVGVLFQWFGVRRHKRTGAYYIRLSRKYMHSKDLKFQTSLEQVKKVYFDFDPLEIHRFKSFPEYPMWLTIELKTGKQIRICKGRRQDLVPVLNWLVAAGLPYTA